jgi:hypothetical protein
MKQPGILAAIRMKQRQIGTVVRVIELCLIALSLISIFAPAMLPGNAYLLMIYLGLAMFALIALEFYLLFTRKERDVVSDERDLQISRLSGYYSYLYSMMAILVVMMLEVFEVVHLSVSQALMLILVWMVLSFEASRQYMQRKGLP